MRLAVRVAQRRLQQRRPSPAWVSTVKANSPPGASTRATARADRREVAAIDEHVGRERPDRCRAPCSAARNSEQVGDREPVVDALARAPARSCRRQVDADQAGRSTDGTPRPPARCRSRDRAPSRIAAAAPGTRRHRVQQQLPARDSRAARAAPRRTPAHAGRTAGAHRPPVIAGVASPAPSRARCSRAP